MKRLIFSGISGMVNTRPPDELYMDQDTGLSPIQYAENVVLTPSGVPVTRGGSEQQVVGDCHSLFPTKCGRLLFAQETGGGEIEIKVGTPGIDGRLQVKTITSGIRSGVVSWEHVDGKYWWSNGNAHGYIDNEMRSHDWPYKNSQFLLDSKIEYLQFPHGKHICFHVGRWLTSIGSEIVWSDAGYDWGGWGVYAPMYAHFILEGPCRLMVSVDTGVFVSDDKGVSFLQGSTPNDWVQRRVLNYPAVPYARAAQLVDTSSLGLDVSQQAALFDTVRGPVVGLQDGTVLNLIEKNYAVDSCNRQVGGIMKSEANLITSGV